MVLNKAGKDIPECYANQYGVFENETANIHAYKEASRKIEPVLPGKSKVLGSIREAIEKNRANGRHDDLLPPSFSRRGLYHESRFGRDRKNGHQESCDCP